MNFSDAFGQEQVIDYLKTVIKKGTIGHAYAFDGSPGIGKTLIALVFAKILLCKKMGIEPCDQCSSCLKFNHHNHPDVHIIEPDGNSIKNKQIEDFQHELMRKPYESQKKIFIIKKANEMSVSAQNRLLKTLEEPPKYAVIILISSNVNGFLPTIKSRCQVLKFKRVGERKIGEMLEKKYDLTQNEAKMLAVFSNGIVENALKLMESQEFKDNRDKIIEIIEKLLSGDQFSVFQMADFFVINKDQFEEYLDIMIFWFRDLLILRETDSEELLINQDKKTKIQMQLDTVEYDRISNIIAVIEKTKTDIKANVNFQLAIEMMLLNILGGMKW